jgi:hypothetical protein
MDGVGVRGLGSAGGSGEGAHLLAFRDHEVVRVQLVTRTQRQIWATHSGTTASCEGHTIVRRGHWMAMATRKRSSAVR